MGKLNEIKRKKVSTHKTAQITRALELVSSSKLSRLANKNAQGKLYASLLSTMIGNLSENASELIENNEFFLPHESVKVVGIVVISSDRGLCGNLNTLLFKTSSINKYKKIMLPILEEEGVPPEIFYVSVIESGLNPLALSYAQASGPWQFISSTGKVYGLQKNWYIDERRDFIKSTHAAARYLKDLKKIKKKK